MVTTIRIRKGREMEICFFKTKHWRAFTALFGMASLLLAAVGCGAAGKAGGEAASGTTAAAAASTTAATADAGSGEGGTQDLGEGQVPQGAAGAEAGQGDGQLPIATIEMEDGGKIVVELYPDVAPNTVKNFISLANSGFYDGLIFHRVIPGFMIQGGDPTGTGSGGPEYYIPGEFSDNGVDNDLQHTRGVISMARSSHPDSAGSQFFIMVADASHLDGGYAAFGKAVSGMEEADKIVSAETDASDRPLTEQKIKQIRVETHGQDYGAPTTLARD
jgi:peptidyl-prolyl cis-trans isomerase B (cyclophilin B)